MNYNSISIIICAYNSEQRIGEALVHLAQQEAIDKFDIELLVIDNNSTDNTQKAAKTKWEEIGAPFKMKIIFESKQGIIHARKTGVNHALYPLILFVDDDNHLDPTYITKGLDILNEHSTIGILGGFGIGQYKQPPPDWLNPGFPFKSLSNSLAITSNSTNNTGILKGKNEFIFGASSFYKKAIFDTLKNLSYALKLTGRSGDVLLSGEDQELCYIAKMMGYDLYRSDKISFKHAIPHTRLTYAYFKKLFYGFGFSSLVLNIYSTIHHKNEYKFNRSLLMFKSQVKIFFFNISYAFFKLHKKKFFKLSLLSSFEDGSQDFLKKTTNIDEITNSITALKKQLNK